MKIVIFFLLVFSVMGQEILKKAKLAVIQQEQLFDCEQFPAYDLILKVQGFAITVILPNPVWNNLD